MVCNPFVTKWKLQKEIKRNSFRETKLPGVTGTVGVTLDASPEAGSMVGRGPYMARARASASASRAPAPVPTVSWSWTRGRGGVAGGWYLGTLASLLATAHELSSVPVPWSDCEDARRLCKWDHKLKVHASIRFRLVLVFPSKCYIKNPTIYLSVEM